MSLETIALAAILGLSRAPAVDVERERPRLEALARSIARGVERADADNPFRGPARREAAVLMLVAIAKHESNFAAAVETCERRGDPTSRKPEGRSVTLWQLMPPWATGSHTVDELCGSVELAAAQALRVFARHAERCATGPWLSAFQGYAGGACGRKSLFPERRKGKVVLVDQGRERCQTWERLASQAGLDGARCDSGRRQVKRKEDPGGES